jgi:hypothetical protein
MPCSLVKSKLLEELSTIIFCLLPDYTKSHARRHIILFCLSSDCCILGSDSLQVGRHTEQGDTRFHANISKDQLVCTAPEPRRYYQAESDVSFGMFVRTYRLGGPTL